MTDLSETSAGIAAFPAGACDAHLHLYDSSIIARPAAPNPLAGCTAARYRDLRDRLGLRRAVIVTPAPHRVDNSVTLAAIQELGAADTRGVAVVFPDVTDAELDSLDAGGICGIRFTVAIPATAITRIDMIEGLARRVAELGWHVQLHMTSAQIAQHGEMILRLPGTVVFDHMGRLADAGADARAWDVVQARLRSGRGWAKLAGHYFASSADQARTVARRLLAIAPDRLVWGSDWPHPTEMPSPPPTESTWQALCDWVPDEAQRQRILVDNPGELYSF